MRQPNYRLQGSYGAELNLRSHLLFMDQVAADPDNIVTAFLAWNLNSIHEHGHWVRYNGTSIGMFLSLLRRTRDSLAGYVLSNLDHTDIVRFSRDRGDGVALFQFEEEDYQDRLGRNLSYSRFDWLDLKLTYDLFFDPHQLPQSLQWELSSAVETSIFNIANQSDRWGGYHPPGDLNLIDKVSLVETEFGPISTRLLFECAAIVDEAYYAYRGDIFRDAGEDLRRGMRHKLRSSYGMPYIFARHVLGENVKPEVVHALIDFSLNLPVPGIVPFAGNRVSWRELYPPHRFVDGILALRARRSVFEGLTSNPENLWEFYGNLENLTGLRYSPVTRPLSEARRIQDLDARGTAATEVIPNLNLLYTTRLGALRIDRPEIISHYGLNFVGEGISVFLEEEEPWWLRAPFSVIEDEFCWPADQMDQDTATDYMLAICMSGALDDIVHGVGHLGAEHLPAKSLSSEGKWMNKIVEDAFPITVRWEV